MVYQFVSKPIRFCEECPIRESYEAMEYSCDQCGLTGEQIINPMIKPVWCPLQEV